MKGSCGITYKVRLEDGVIVAVKRLQDVIVGKEEFELQMKVIGSIRHENVMALIAYYYSKDEKLLVYDHCCQGSVSVLLHANKSKEQESLGWESRFLLAIGAARGLAHLHEISSSAHGKITSSNIFLNSKQYGCVSEVGMAAITHPAVLGNMQPAGYRAPEVTATRKISQAADVYSFGVLLLELLTGKSPLHSLLGDERINLVAWVQSRTANIFDASLLKEAIYNEKDMVKMLQIGMVCVQTRPVLRPKMKEVVEMLEDIISNSRILSENRSVEFSPVVAIL